MDDRLQFQVRPAVTITVEPETVDRPGPEDLHHTEGEGLKRRAEKGVK
jgi:hypothetical protein